ncbi:hypothetical protein Abor_003_033 [Acetobacter orientalis]|uniref:Uncharacterized protein n=1 Tax=Acetobacter orientalis TaxID=146474 RepID=A0A2Z5ZHP4_9PROT|nr:hypothetical protein Abor_003_033 [Acetobacter orientalis]
MSFGVRKRVVGCLSVACVGLSVSMAHATGEALAPRLFTPLTHGKVRQPLWCGC